jgi:hypothetical protein
MGILLLLLLLMVAIVGFCAYYISRSVYRKLKENENQYSLGISIAVFIISFAIIFWVLGYVVASHIPFGR